MFRLMNNIVSHWRFHVVERLQRLRRALRGTLIVAWRPMCAARLTGKGRAKDGMDDTQRQKIRDASHFKQQAFFALEDLACGNVWSRVFGIFLFALIVSNAILVFVEAEPIASVDARAALHSFGLVSTLCFGVEYAARLWIADLVYPRSSAGKARVRYALSLMGIIDLLSFAPGVLALFVPLPAAALNAVRIIRLVRLIKISRYMRGLRSIWRVLEKRRSEIVAAFMVLALLTVVASVLMYEVEHPAQPEKFDSMLTGMYWAMTTITTTGYGDLVPVTDLGRLIGFFTMVLSIGAVAIPAGIFSAGFIEEFRAQDEIERENLRRARRERRHAESDDDEDAYEER